MSVVGLDVAFPGVNVACKMSGHQKCIVRQMDLVLLEENHLKNQENSKI